jgi:hypothetical protein
LLCDCCQHTKTCLIVTCQSCYAFLNSTHLEQHT